MPLALQIVFCLTVCFFLGLGFHYVCDTRYFEFWMHLGFWPGQVIGFVFIAYTCSALSVKSEWRIALLVLCGNVIPCEVVDLIRVGLGNNMKLLWSEILDKEEMEYISGSSVRGEERSRMLVDSLTLSGIGVGKPTICVIFRVTANVLDSRPFGNCLRGSIQPFKESSLLQ